jgi:hypothetical protein
MEEENQVKAYMNFKRGWHCAYYILGCMSEATGAIILGKCGLALCNKHLHQWIRKFDPTKVKILEFTKEQLDNSEEEVYHGNSLDGEPSDNR